MLASKQGQSRGANPPPGTEMGDKGGEEQAMEVFDSLCLTDFLKILFFQVVIGAPVVYSVPIGDTAWTTWRHEVDGKL